MTTEQDYRVAVAAYALGGLEPQEASELEAHLDTCPDCQRELAEFSKTAAQLALVPPELLAEALADDPAVPAARIAAEGSGPDDDLVLQRTLRQVRAERAGARRRRVLAVAAALVVLVAAPVITALAVHRNGGSPVAAPPAASTPAGQTVRASDPATGLAGVATLVAAPWGTKLQAKFTGEPRGEKCRLFAVSTSGERQVAANWTVTDAAAAGAGTNLQGSVSIPEKDVAQLEVQTFGGRRLLTMTV
jgi:anti-sigma factor RsiW